MLDFPYSESSGWFGLAFAGIGTTLSVIFVLVARFIGFRSWGGPWPLAWYPQFLLIAPLAVVAGLAIAVPAFWTVKRFRDIDMSQVVGWNAFKVNEDDYPIGPSRIEFRNVSETQRSLRLLEYCKGVGHQHDVLGGGYLLQLRLLDDKTKDLYLRVYRTSSNSSRKVIVPKSGGSEAGEYDCPQLQQWVVDNIDPLFKTPR